MKMYPVLNLAPRHENVWASGGIAPRILRLGTRWKWVVGFTPRPLYSGKRAPAIQRIRGWVCPRVDLEAMAKKKRIPTPCRELNPSRNLILCREKQVRVDNCMWYGWWQGTFRSGKSTKSVGDILPSWVPDDPLADFLLLLSGLRGGESVLVVHQRTSLYLVTAFNYGLRQSLGSNLA